MDCVPGTLEPRETMLTGRVEPVMLQNDNLKLVLAGPVGAGKTTTIRSLADTEPVSTEMPMIDGPMGDKTTTTVALDFAPIILDDGTPLFLYGLPGQHHFSHMRSILLKGAVGVILLLDAQGDVTGDCQHWLSSIREIDAEVPLVIGITKSELTPNFSMSQVREAVGTCGAPIPTFTFDARDREQAAHLVRALLVCVE